MSNLQMFNDMAESQAILNRVIQNTGIPYADPYNEEATISAVSDPKQEGRVKVIYKKDGIQSDWLYVNGSGSGQLSSQFIGARCTIVKIGGNSAAGIVTAIYSSEQGQGSIGNPIQIPTVSDQLASKSPGGDGDPGLKCNEGNKGRTYIISNEMGQDLVICLRRNSPQRDGTEEASWSWKSLSHSEWIEKGLDPGAASDPTVSDKYKSNPGIPTCTKALAGEVHEFSEDRAYRSMLIRCRRDENGNYGWIPEGATPTFFRTTLPNCSEALHGMNAVVDTGRESEFVVCSRYAGKMLWTKQGKREPLQFFNKDLPPKKSDWIKTITPIDKLSFPTAKDTNFARGFEESIIKEALVAIPPFGTDPTFRLLLEAANVLPGKFDAGQTWSNVAKTLITNRSNLSVDTIVSQLSRDFEAGGDLSPGTADVLSTLGGLADVLVSGTRGGDVRGSLETIGKQALNQALNNISPAAASIYTSYMSGGALGAIDTAVATGLDILPPTLGGVLSPLFNIGELALKGQPLNYSTIIDAALNGGLAGTVQSILDGKADFSNFNLDKLASLVTEGSLGSIASLFSDFSNIDSIEKLAGSIPKLATTALGLLGQGKGFADFLGPGGIGLDAVKALTGNNPVVGILGGLAGGLFGKGKSGSGCPCDPSCRKTKHGKDSDGGNLLEKCGSNPSNTTVSYSPTNNPIQNNLNVVADVLKVLPTGLGKSLKVSSLLDLGLLLTSPKLKDLAKTVFNARFADNPEWMSELAYSFEAVQTALKQTDNNITKVESVERKLIDVSHNLLTSLFETGGGSKKGLSTVNKLLEAVKDNSEAIKDLYKFAKSLDNIKKGGKAGVIPTSAIVKSIKNIKQLSRLNSLSKKKANTLLNKGIRRADKEWRSLNPGLDKFNLANVVLGEFSPDVPALFESDDMETFFNEDRVLNYSLASRINDTSPQQEDITPRLYPDSVPNDTLNTIFNEIQKANEGNPDC